MDKAGSFLQSPAWGAVQTAYGRKTKIIDGHLAIRYPLPLQQWYWFVPYGPYVDGLNDGAVFVRYEPDQPTSDRRVQDVHPSKTFITPLIDPDTMLKNMKQKCRYNLNLAQRKQITVRETTDVDMFYAVLKKTGQRQDIRLHPKHYYRVMIDTLKKEDMVKVYSAWFEGQPIAVAMVIYYGDTVTYLHGGTDYAHRALMAPYLLHWRVMTDAVTAGCHYYDWFGISDRWPGVTRFKMGFGGTVVERPGTFEHVLRPVWYTGYRMMKRLWIS